ncbi:MAG: carbohydrate ABC transporter permease [Anaerolineales bacterium]|nr:carbohydrate ABC transporter permease [Anaerolineales bacterium]
MRKMKPLRQLLSQLALGLIGIYVIIPIWGILRLTFDGAIKSRATEFHWFPKEFSIQPFLSALDRPYQTASFMTLFQNSMLVSVSAALAAVVLGISLAYAFARFRFPGRQTGLFVILLTAVLPPIAFTTPLYLLLSWMQLRTTLLGLAIVYAAFAMPFCVWNLRAAFQAIPKELEEAAFLDGAGYFTTFWRITLPMAAPSIAVAALIAFLMAYSEFTIGWLFVEKTETVTLAMSIYAILTSGSAQPWSQIGALAILMSAPVVVIFLIFQRTLLERMMFGTTTD